MPKRIYQLGEPCDVCGTPTIQGNNGAYCKPCYISWKNGQQKAPQQKYQKPIENKPDWDKIASGKVRHGLVCAMLQAGKDIPFIKTHLLELENIVMRGIRLDDDVPDIQAE